MRQGVLVFFICFVSCVFARPVYAQELYSVRGRIVRTDTGEPLVNANLLVAETGQGTSSGEEGWFEIALPAGSYHLAISAIGYSGKLLPVRVPEGVREYILIELVQEKLEIEGVDIFGVLKIMENDSLITREPVSLLTTITRVSAAEIEKQGAVTVTDALKFVPGGWIETRGRKTKQFFSVRGQKYPYPDYSINGIWQKEFEETVYFLSALDIESIEIVRSSNALVKGLTGLSGVVDVRTRRPDRETVSMLARYGEQNSYVANLQYGNRINDIAFSTSAAFFGTDGPPERNGRERIANFTGSMDWQVNNRFSVYAGSTYIQGLRQLVSIEEPGAQNIATRQEKFDPVRTLLSYVKLNYHGDNGSVTELQTNLAYRNLDYNSFDIVQETDYEHSELDYEYGFNLLHSRFLTSSNTLRIGVLYNHWIAPEGKRYYVGQSCNAHTWSGVIASEQRAGRFIFDGGLRFIGGYIVEWGGFGIEGSAAGFQNVKPVENQLAPSEWQSVLGATYILSGSASFHYNFTGGTVAPRRGGLNYQGNRPENEIRFQHDLGFRLRSANFGEVSLSSFYIQRRDAVELSGETVTTDEGFIMELYENIDKRSFGLELTSRLGIPQLHSSIFANATLMKGENIVNGEYEKDGKMPNVILNFGVQFDYSAFDANLYFNYTGPYANNRFVNRVWIIEHGDFPLGDFMAIDITAGYTFNRKYSTRLFAEIKNVSDKRFLTVAGYSDPGRLFSTGARVYF